MASTHSVAGRGPGWGANWFAVPERMDCLLYYYDLLIHLPNLCHKQENTMIQSNKTKNRDKFEERRSRHKKKIRFRGKSKTCLAFYLAYANIGSVIYL